MMRITMTGLLASSILGALLLAGCVTEEVPPPELQTTAYVTNEPEPEVPAPTDANRPHTNAASSSTGSPSAAPASAAMPAAASAPIGSTPPPPIGSLPPPPPLR